MGKALMKNGKLLNIGGGSGEKIGTVIDPLGTLNKLYINCDLTKDELTEIMANVTAWEREHEWNNYMMFEDEHATEEMYGCVTFADMGSGDWMFGLPTMGTLMITVRDEGLAPGIYKADFEHAIFEKLSGVVELTFPGTPWHGVETSTITGETVGAVNNKLTKLFSFNTDFVSSGTGKKILIK